MKIPSILSFFFIIISLISCTKSNSTSTSDSNTSNIISSGTWIVTFYNDNGTDELYHFSGYNFTFSNGIVTAIKNGATVSGIYNIKNDDNINKLILDFNTITPFDELNDDWHIQEITFSKIRLQDISGGNGGIDYLTFEKK